MIDAYLIIIKELDEIYSSYIEGNSDSYKNIDSIVDKLAYLVENYDGILNDDEINLVVRIISDKINLLTKLENKEKMVSFDKIKENFKVIEYLHFNIANSYVMGTLKIEEINEFEKKITLFRDELYSVEINDDNIMEIAKMKSIIQHFRTELLEDDEILSLAYSNSI